MIDKERESKFFNEYVSKLPRVPLDAPLERGRVYHTVMQYDDWCSIYDGKECNCNPVVSRYIEPKRS